MTKNKDALIILHPRRIPEALEAFDALRDTDLIWISGYTEIELCKVIPGVIGSTEHDRYGIVSDDAVVSQEAFHGTMMMSRAFPETCWTGYCNLEESGPSAHLANVCSRPLPPGDAPPQVDDYSFIPLTEVADAQKVYFTGMCLTTMTASMWRRFPFGCFRGGNGYASDFHLSRRLQAAEVDIRAYGPPCRHLKKTWNTSDKTPGRELHLGPHYQTITVEQK